MQGRTRETTFKSVNGIKYIDCTSYAERHNITYQALYYLYKRHGCRPEIGIYINKRFYINVNLEKDFKKRQDPASNSKILEELYFKVWDKIGQKMYRRLAKVQNKLSYKEIYALFYQFTFTNYEKNEIAIEALKKISQEIENGEKKLECSTNLHRK